MASIPSPPPLAIPIYLHPPNRPPSSASSANAPPPRYLVRLAPTAAYPSLSASASAHASASSPPPLLPVGRGPPSSRTALPRTASRSPRSAADALMRAPPHLVLVAERAALVEDAEIRAALLALLSREVIEGGAGLLALRRQEKEKEEEANDGEARGKGMTTTSAPVVGKADPRAALVAGLALVSTRVVEGPPAAPAVPSTPSSPHTSSVDAGRLLALLDFAVGLHLAEGAQPPRDMAARSAPPALAVSPAANFDAAAFKLLPHVSPRTVGGSGADEDGIDEDEDDEENEEPLAGAHARACAALLFANLTWRWLRVCEGVGAPLPTETGSATHEEQSSPSPLPPSSPLVQWGGPTGIHARLVAELDALLPDPGPAAPSDHDEEEDDDAASTSASSPPRLPAFAASAVLWAREAALAALGALGSEVAEEGEEEEEEEEEAAAAAGEQPSAEVRPMQPPPSRDPAHLRPVAHRAASSLRQHLPRTVEDARVNVAHWHGRFVRVYAATAPPTSPAASTSPLVTPFLQHKPQQEAMGDGGGAGGREAGAGAGGGAGAGEDQDAKRPRRR
jgi:hypothetical protein